MNTARLSGSHTPDDSDVNRVSVEDLYRLAHILEEAAEVFTDHPDRTAVAVLDAVPSQPGRVEMALGMLAEELLHG